MATLEYLLNILHEDCPFGDITSDSVIPDLVCRAVITSEQPAVIAGLAEASALFQHHGVTVECPVEDGARVTPGTVVLELRGRARMILLVERTALNIIGRMSGIATMTRHYVELARKASPSCRIAATRKTCPGFRELDKKAVFLGGGDPHRWSLSDGILIKDNHLALVSIPDAIARAKTMSSYHIVEIEVTSENDAVSAASAGADIVMLDNMSPEEVRATIKTLERNGLRERVFIELSGSITEETLPRFAGTGADIISIGALTHSAKNISVSLDIVRMD